MRKLHLLLAAYTFSVAASAIEPLWLRDVKISPNGEEILFTYMGDIYKVSSQGGTAIRITATSAYESNPVWSPDGKSIAFSNDRFGSKDVYVISAEGGTPRRLTTNSANENVESFAPDGKTIYFSSVWQDPAQSALFPRSFLTELYQIPVEGGRAKQVFATPTEAISFDRSGTRMLYQDHKGLENIWRKHHTSSVTMNIWMAENGRHTRLTNHPGEDRNPVFAPDQKHVYLLSERDGGSMNVYQFDLNKPDVVRPVTQFKNHPVRFLSVAQNGLLCYTYDGSIYTQQTDSQPQKVSIQLTADNQPDIEDLTYRSGASEAAVSPDGKQIALIIRGDVWVTSVEYATTKQITQTPEIESGISWGADSKTLVYASERKGNWGLYLAKVNRKDEPGFPVATLIKEEALIPSSNIERTCPRFSPDGKEIAFVQNRKKIMIVNLATKQIRQITDGSHWFNNTGYREFTWSPDGRWLAFEWIGHHHDPYTDIAIVRTDGKSAPVQITASGYFSSSPKWVLNGNALLFTTDRYGMRSHASWGSLDDIMIVFMNQNAFDRFRLSKEDYELLKALEKEQEKAKTSVVKAAAKKGKAKKELSTAHTDTDKQMVVETDGIEERIVRLTPTSAHIASAILSKDGEDLYFLARFEKGYDMWKIGLRDQSMKLLHKLNGGAASLETDKEQKDIFLLGKNLQKMNGTSEKLSSIAFNASAKLNHSAERAAMYEHVVRQIEKRFYNTNLHSVNWPMMTAAYRKFLPHINNNYDYADLLSELLGELNVSHTGGRYRPSADTPNRTAQLGLFFNLQNQEDGLLIDEVVEKGPFDRKTSRVKAGDIITRIDGETINKETDYWNLLNGKVGKRTLVSFKNPQTGETWDEVIKPISQSTLSDLLYKRWVKQRAEDVKRWSNGRLGYVHIESMDDDSYRTIYADILGRYNDCDGIVIDTRFNGGGRLHEDIEILFSGQEYFKQVVRGEVACAMPSRRWNKPSIMLQNEANYSNAHGTPWVYKHMKLGKLVGTPVPGTMTSVNWETMQDPSLVFGIPVTGYRLPDGTYLENSQLEPDVYVENAPETIVKGEDTQLKVAVETLLKQIDEAKK